MLRHSREALVQQELEAVVIRANAECPPPHIWPPVAHSLHQADELPLVCRQLVMASGKGTAEESQRPLSLMQDGAETDTGCIAVHDEQLVEVRHLEDGPCREGLLEGLERLATMQITPRGSVAVTSHC